MHSVDRLTRIYDALYVALAETLEATAVTRDASLAKAVGELVKVGC